MDETTPSDEKKVKDDRRNFLKATVVASAALAVGGMAAVAKVLPETGGISASQSSNSTASGFPRFLIADVNSGQVANVNTLQLNAPLTFFYPLNDNSEASVVVKTGVQCENGVGPENDIVAFSDVCQHLGCNPLFVGKGQTSTFNAAYVAPNPVLYCPCHGSQYDLSKEAQVIGGPAPRPVPQVTLEVDAPSGNIYATGMGPPVIWSSTGAHGPLGSTDVTGDLMGGTPDPSSSEST